VESGLRESWPKNLSVRSLSIIGSLNVNDIERLGAIECQLELTFDSVAAEQMYQLLERMGQFVKTLSINNDSSYRRPDIVYVKTEIILERILAACPNLEQFKINNNRAVVLDDGFDLPPSAFKNYKE
jgi:hypothetical protein